MVQLARHVTVSYTPEGALLLNEKTGKYWQLNRTGAQVLTDLLAGNLPDTICAEVAANYGIPADRVRADVLRVIDQLHRSKLVQ